MSALLSDKSALRISVAEAMRLMQEIIAVGSLIQKMSKDVLQSFVQAGGLDGGVTLLPDEDVSRQGVVPSTVGFPPWAARCVLRRERRAKGIARSAVHLSEPEIREGKNTPAYELIAAARNHCIACIRRHLLQGHRVDLCSNSGWNAWDNAHYRDSPRRIAVLQYLETAGLHASRQYGTFRNQHVALLRRSGTVKMASLQLPVPSLGSYPTWASVCVSDRPKSIDLEPGQVHMTEEEVHDDEIMPDYFVIAAGNASCLCCIRDCLARGYSIHNTSRNGLNVWDMVHMKGGERTIDTLRFIEEAGGRVSEVYALRVARREAVIST